MSPLISRIAVALVNCGSSGEVNETSSIDPNFRRLCLVAVEIEAFVVTLRFVISRPQEQLRLCQHTRMLL